MIEKSFLNEGKDAGLKKLQEARAGFPDLLDENGLRSIAQYLNETGPATKIVGHYLDGTTDESPRGL